MKLSGEERQRIAIAKGLLQNTPIMILDEATASRTWSSKTGFWCLKKARVWSRECITTSLVSCLRHKNEGVGSVIKIGRDIGKGEWKILAASACCCRRFFYGDTSCNYKPYRDKD